MNLNYISVLWVARSPVVSCFLKSGQGTYPYLSTELMFGADGRGVKHRPCDDLESFFWIFWIMSINYAGPFNVTRDWADV
jgi:hypothetical protein